MKGFVKFSVFIVVIFVVCFCCFIFKSPSLSANADNIDKLLISSKQLYSRYLTFYTKIGTCTPYTQTEVYKIDGIKDVVENKVYGLVNGKCHVKFESAYDCYLPSKIFIWISAFLSSYLYWIYPSNLNSFIASFDSVDIAPS